MASSNERKLFRVSVICILIIAVIMSMIISLIWGSTPVSLAEIWHTLWSSELIHLHKLFGIFDCLAIL